MKRVLNYDKLLLIKLCVQLYILKLQKFIKFNSVSKKKVCFLFHNKY